MKKVNYCGTEFLVPSNARYLTCDARGFVRVFAAKPLWCKEYKEWRGISTIVGTVETDVLIEI